MTENLTANGRPVPGGFTGTLRGFLDFLAEHVSGYGGMVVGEPQPCEWYPSRGDVVRIELVTGGYSDDEALMSRVRSSLFGFRFWESTHRGGLYVYEVPLRDLDSDTAFEWLEPDSDAFETLYRVRSISLDTGHGRAVLPSVHGVELSFAEPDRDVNDPAAVLSIRQLRDDEVPDVLRPRTDEARPLSEDDIAELLGPEGLAPTPTDQETP